MLIQSERAVLALVMDRQEFAPKLFSNLTSEHFRDSKNRSIYMKMSELYEEHKSLEWASVIDAMGHAIDSAHWQDLMSATRGVHYNGAETFLDEKIRAIKADYGKKRIISDIEAIAKKPTLDEEDEQALADHVQSIRVVGKEKESHDFESALSAYYENLYRDKSGVRLGYSALDKRIDGFNFGELVTIMSRATVGKTFLALNIVYKLTPGIPYKVGFFSLEMPKAAIIERMMQLHFDLNRNEINERVKNGTIDLHEFSSNMQNIFIYDRVYSSGEIKQIIVRDELKVIFVDFLHLVRSDHPEASPYIQISNIVRDFKQAAKDTSSVIFMLHQLSRKAGDGWVPVELSHARDAGTVEELSDFLIGIYAPGLDPTKKDANKDELSIVLLKNKRGERWLIKALFNKTSGRIAEVDDERKYETYSAKDENTSRRGKLF